VTLRPTVVATSLKMYFGLERTVEWVDGVVALDVPSDTEVIVMPSFLAIPAVADRIGQREIGVGGQNLHYDDAGAFTGEVSGAQLREAGCRFVEVGHAERERLFGETERDVALKLAAAWRNELCPILCIGEPEEGDPEAAAAWCADKLARLIAAGHEVDGATGHDLIVAYEPVWAIGATSAASPAHVTAVARSLREVLARSRDLGDTRVIYGGSAGVGLLTELGDAVDGLFLGRFAHEPAAVDSILRERPAAAGR
jgi:triosephosphate isomerase (TIM)